MFLSPAELKDAGLRYNHATQTLEFIDSVGDSLEGGGENVQKKGDINTNEIKEPKSISSVGATKEASKAKDSNGMKMLEDGLSKISIDASPASLSRTNGESISNDISSNSTNESSLNTFSVSSSDFECSLGDKVKKCNGVDIGEIGVVTNIEIKEGKKYILVQPLNSSISKWRAQNIKNFEPYYEVNSNENKNVKSDVLLSTSLENNNKTSKTGGLGGSLSSIFNTNITTTKISNINDSNSNNDNSNRCRSCLKGNKSNRQNKKINWGNVNVAYFSRTLGASAVTNSGTFPLGLGNETSRESESVREHEDKRQQELAERAKAYNNVLVRPKRSSRDSSGGVLPPSSISSSFTPPKESFLAKVMSAMPSDSIYYETRQLDYKHGLQNQLFGPLSEEQRMNIFTQNQIPLSGDTQKYCKETKVLIEERDSNCGCKCKPLKVDKLSIKQMKSELNAHGSLVNVTDRAVIENMAKADMEVKLKELTKIRTYCDAAECECSRNGIPCHDDVCDCSGKCGNQLGKVNFDSSVVKEYRSKIVSIEPAKRPSRSLSM